MALTPLMDAFSSRILRAGLAYFALVFGAGFALGTVRVAFLLPRLGERTAELVELPVMLAICYLAARWAVRRFAVPWRSAPRLAMGFLAVALLLVLEFTLVLWLRGLTLAAYFATRDPVAGTAYYASLLVFALLPALVGRR